VPVLVMHVRRVRMRVPEAHMCVPVRVRLARRIG
jgi:hypothetical protein